MPLARHDLQRTSTKPCLMVFLLTCLLRGMTTIAGTDITTITFLLTCLLRGMTKYRNGINGNTYVSTHMPLARHDSIHPAAEYCK